MSSIKKWSNEELEILTENYEKIGPKKCSEMIGRTKENECY